MPPQHTTRSRRKLRLSQDLLQLLRGRGSRVFLDRICPRACRLRAWRRDKTTQVAKPQCRLGEECNPAQAASTTEREGGCQPMLDRVEAVRCSPLRTA